MYCIAPTGIDRTPVDCAQVDALIVVDRTELAQFSPFYLDQVAAVAIGQAMLLVMSVAFLFRMVRKYLEGSSSNEES